MKRREMFERISVLCPLCGGDREINKSSYKGDLSVLPYVQPCRPCTNKQRQHTPESRALISEALSGQERSEETKEKIRAYRKAHPELWTTLQPELGPIARKGLYNKKNGKK